MIDGPNMSTKAVVLIVGLVRRGSGGAVVRRGAPSSVRAIATRSAQLLLRSGVDVVESPLSVRDREGRLLSKSAASDFKSFENSSPDDRGIPTESMPARTAASAAAVLPLFSETMWPR